MHNEQSPKKSVGRPRSQEAYQAILKAVTEILEQEGYTRVTIEGVAERAGVGKMTIYRWWPSKAALVMDAYLVTAMRRIDLPDTGAVQNDLQVFAERLFHVLTTTNTGRTISGIVVEMYNDPALAHSFREFVAKRREATQILLQRGIARGELREDIDLEAVLDYFYGPIWYRFLLRGAAIDSAFAATHTRNLTQWYGKKSETPG